MLKSARSRLSVGLIIAFAVLVALIWTIDRHKRQTSAITSPSPSSTLKSSEQTHIGETQTPNAVATSPSPIISEAPSSTELGPTPDPNAAPPSFVGTLRLIIPVSGVTSDQLHDTFDDARSEGRVHDAIDIPAPAGTSVLAAADGQIIKLFQSERGGTTIYQLSNDQKLVFYYAHLQRYADNLTEGKFVRQGEVIAYVGDTGNAGAGNYHLHFSIAVLNDPKRYWEGTNINPYPILKGRAIAH